MWAVFISCAVLGILVNKHSPEVYGRYKQSMILSFPPTREGEQPDTRRYNGVALEKSRAQWQWVRT